MGKWFEDTAPLENLVLSWVRCVVGDDWVEILRVGLYSTHVKLKIFLACTTLKIKKKCFPLLHFVSYFLQVNVPNAAHVSRTLDSL